MPEVQFLDTAYSIFPLLVLCVPVFIFFYLGLRERLHTGTFILVFCGFCLVLFASIIDFTEGFDSLSDVPIFGRNDPRRGIYKGFFGGLLGLMCLILGTWWEIRLLRMREAEEAKSGDLKEAILASMGDGVIVVDKVNRILFVNPAAEELLGTHSEEVVGSDLSEHLPAKEVGKSGINVILGIQQYQLPGNGEAGLQEGEADDRVMSVSVMPLRSADEELAGTVRSLHDVTELAKVNQLKSEYVSTVSHEMRSPLASIKAYLELLLEGEAGELSDMQLEALQVMEASTNRIIDMVNNFLDLARIEEGIVSLEKKPFILDSVVNEAIQPLRNQFDEKGVRLRLNMPDRPVWVSGDRGRILQIITNLLSNAYKYTPRDGLVGISAMIRGRQVQVDVVDSGIGIAEDDQSKVFTKFFRGSNNDQAGQVTGSGLGLAISKSIVEMHGGEIWLTSSLGTGSTFSFTLPRAGATEASS